MTSTPRYDIAIVGGGFSGTILAVQLLKRSAGKIAIAVINRAGRPGRGVAYGTQDDAHLLNVSAKKMSAFPDDAEHFFHWLTKVRGCSIPPESFAPRRLYGDYLEHTLRQTLQKYPEAAFAWIAADAESLTLRSGTPHLSVSTGVDIAAETAVLATGNAPPVDPLALQPPANGFSVSYAWAPNALEGIPPDGGVLILGSGLTAIDQLITLHNTKFKGKIFLLSRRGQLPAVHATSGTWPSDWAANLPHSVRPIVASVRAQVQLAGSQNIDWRAVIDSMRPHTSEIWGNLPLLERKRFLRHVRPFWEVVRHRVPPEIHQLLAELIDRNALQVLAGRLLKAEQSDRRVDVTFCPRGTDRQRVLSVDRILNCTGPGTSVRVQDRLILNLLDKGMARMDPLQIGIETDCDGAVVAASGVPSTCLYAIGPVRKASLWETTAVPEIRVQAAELAEHLLSRLHRA